MKLRAKIRKVAPTSWCVRLTFLGLGVGTAFFPDFDSALDFAVQRTSR